MTQKSQEVRSSWTSRWLADLSQDLRYSFRGMRRNMGFTAFVILIAGLGIGASSTVFSVVNALLLQPLPFSDAARLVWISNKGQNGVEWTTQVGTFQDLRDQNRSFVDLAGWFGGYGIGDRQLSGAGEPERLTAVPVTQNFFSLLGVQPLLGRSFTADECKGRYNAPPAVLLSYGFWQRRFAADRSIAGRKLMLNNQPATVVGVLPKSFDFESVFAPGSPVDIFIPWPLSDETNQRGNSTRIIARLKSGATLDGARAEFTDLAKQIGTQHPERNGIVPDLIPLAEHVNGRTRPALLVLACAVCAVMLIVCANLSNLQLARMTSRHRELTMRMALGAGRLRLLRQMLTETIVLSCCGAALGLILAQAGTRIVAHLSAFPFPLRTSVRVDATALAFTLLAAVLTGVLFGLLPALQIPAFQRNALKEGGSRMSDGKGRTWLRDTLVVSEIAFACFLLVGAGLLIRSFVRLLDVNPGFQTEQAVAIRVDPSFRISSFAQQNTYVDEMLRAVRSVSGIRAAGMTDVLPFAGDRAWEVSGKGQVYAKGQRPQTFVRVVSDGYFEAMGIRLAAGRGFTELDRASTQPVAVVNETFARTLWPGQDAIGQTITQDGGRLVVGVVEDIRHEALEKMGGAEMYLPLRQTSDYSAIELVLRMNLPPDVLAPDIRTALRTIDTNLPVREFQTLRDLVEKTVSPRRFLVLILAGFAAFALLIASLGIYAVVSYSVNQRVKEIGIRVALGASAREVQKGILLGTLQRTALGIALGMIVSRVLANALAHLLFGVNPGDLATFLAAGTLLTAVAVTAAYVPAWRASRIDPMDALRSS